MSARFYAPEARSAGDVIALPADEGEHLSRVLRLAAGAEVRVFDGAGREFDAIVEEVQRGVRVRLTGAAVAAPEPEVAITLALAVLKGDKMDDIVRDTVMMGVAAIQPMTTTRTEVSGAAIDRGKRRERWQRIAVSSSKQCGRAVVPAIGQRQAFNDVIAAIEERRLPGPALMLVEPAASAEAIPLRELAGHPPRETTMLVGPEGGWTPQEIEVGATVCRLVSLGGLTLRADAAPVIALAACFTRWNVY